MGNLLDVKTLKKILSRHYRMVISAVLAFSAFAFLVSALQTPQYRASSRLLIVPKGTIELDSYAASRAGERLGAIIQEVINSNSFLNAVLDSPFGVKNDYPEDLTKRMALWQKRVATQISQPSGVLDIYVYNRQPRQALNTALAINRIVQKTAPSYFGGKGVEIKVLDGPQISDKPVRPKVFLNTLLAAVLALFFSLGGIYIFTDKVEQARKETFIEQRGIYPPVGLPTK